MSFTKFDFTEAKLRQCLPGAPHLGDWFLAIQEILPDYNIDTPLRVAAWLGQTGHESGNYRALRENLNYSAEGLNKIFKKYFPTVESARPYARNPEKIANRVYASRMGNGDEASGDGWKYRGRGLIQLTGFFNYRNFADSIEESVDDVVPFLETFEGAVQSACWFWETNNLNQWADKQDWVTLTKRINGGTIGLEDRMKHINHAVHVLSGH
jgi:putative chitinase